ncbi:MAG TPA: LPS export ABC transporter ATP-binding protein, partial [Bradyrhizobium sp.]|nr:LPS export ABC transporter ATP-binding protein [Bradyrhizobium sp.]
MDLLGMFRRRPANRGKGFARSREDITALGDSMGQMLTSAVRDAPPLARAAPSPTLELPRAEKPPAQRPSPAKAAPRPGGAAPPRSAPRAGYLAVHSVEKSFGTRKVV